VNWGRLRSVWIGVLVASMMVVSGCSGAAPKAGDTAANAKPAESQAKKAIKVGYLNVMDDAQAMLAKDAGFYDKHGLDVELVMFDSGTDMVKAIVGGQLQGGVLGFTNAATWAQKGADIKVVGGAQMGYHSILVRKGSGIKTVADLKGKKLATQQKGSTADVVLNGVVLPQAGLSRTDVNMVYVSPAVAIQSLAAGQVDAAFVFEPYEQIAKATADIEAIYEIGKVWPFPCMVVITSGKLLSEDRDTVNRLLDAQQEAMTMLQKQPKEAAALLTKRFIAEAKLKSPAGVETAAADVVQKAIETQMFHWEITPDETKRMQEVVALMVKQQVLPESIQVEKFLDLTWQQKQGKSAMNH
jgi:NitT/TauT family transport system substrate-binding protein